MFCEKMGLLVANRWFVKNGFEHQRSLGESVSNKVQKAYIFLCFDFLDTVIG